MHHKYFIKFTIFLSLAILGSLGHAKAEESKRIIVTGLYGARDNKLSFGHVDLFNWHMKTQALIREKNLESVDRINDVRNSGHCFDTGACQKEITINLPLETLDSYSKFLALTPQGEVHPISAVKIEATVLLVLSADGKLHANSSGSGRITAESEVAKNIGDGFVFAVPKGSGKMIVTSASSKGEIDSIIKVTEKELSINSEQIPNKLHIKIENITKVFVILFENLPDKYLAINWSSAESHCQNNFSIFRLGGKIEDLEWRGWGCDV